MSPGKHQTCCGQRIRARFDAETGQYVKQSHRCDDASDVRGIDWAALVERQVAAKRESV